MRRERQTNPSRSLVDTDPAIYLSVSLEETPGRIKRTKVSIENPERKKKKKEKKPPGHIRDRGTANTRRVRRAGILNLKFPGEEEAWSESRSLVEELVRNEAGHVPPFVSAYKAKKRTPASSNDTLSSVFLQLSDSLRLLFLLFLLSLQFSLVARRGAGFQNPRRKKKKSERGQYITPSLRSSSSSS